MSNSQQFNIKDRNTIFDKLKSVAQGAPGFKLLTVMDLDMDAGLACRAFSSDPDAYPTSGTKPIVKTQWFEDVVIKQMPFLANHPSQMGDQFPDLDFIKSLGCGSIVNVPVVANGRTSAVINILHEEGYFTQNRYEQALELANLMKR